MRTVLFLSVCLGLAYPTLAFGQTSSDSLAAVRSRLAADPGYAGVFGMAVDGQVTVDAIGESRPGVLHDPRTPVRWASVSKMITAILAFQQIDAGRLALDATVLTYLPESELPNAGQITIGQLLAHKSGLAQQSDFGPGSPGAPGRSCLAASARPGSVFAYNNCDTIVLGDILEAVTGMPIVALANSTIGVPLSLSVSMPVDARTEARMPDGTDEAQVWPSGYGAAGGLYGTIGDLLRIDAAFIQGQLISAESRAVMLDGDPAVGFAAMGVWSYEAELGSCLGKTRLVERYGEIGGVQVRNFLLPDKNLALAIYSNDRRTEFGEVWRGEGLSIELIRAAACPDEGADNRG